MHIQAAEKQIIAATSTPGVANIVQPATISRNLYCLSRERRRSVCLWKQPHRILHESKSLHTREEKLENAELAAPAARPLPLKLIVLVALAVHLPLMLMRLPLKSYDTNFHLFFASHYAHHWFDPWNPKWYAGFSQTTYPPMAQQWVAIFSFPLGLEFGYMAVQLIAILLLAVGAYRFAKLWVNPRAASFAALASVLLGSESLLVYSAGQLPTTFAAPILLNALPYMYEWIRYGRRRSFINALALFAAVAAAHHATLLFGTPFFIFPVIALAALDRNRGEHASGAAITRRTISIAIATIIAFIIVILPFWIALIHYPVTQTPIPHASRANFILSPQYSVQEFFIPYGAMILALPFIFIRGSRVTRLRPLMFGFWVAFLIGLGGTTPIGHILLRRAFQVLTMERFTYWATLLALPFVGLLAAELIARYQRKAMVALAIAAIFTCGFGVAFVTYRLAGVQPFNVKPVAQWLNTGGHNKYRYITLGFSNQLSHVARLADADSVDGEWNSGRHVPELTHHSVGPLTDSKYYGQSGLEALRLVMRHANHYGLKWIFVHDPYYDPLLYFSGWRHVDNLDNGQVTVWSKDGVPPAVPMNAAFRPPRWQGVWWGVLPILSSIIAIVLVLIPYRRETGGEDYGEEGPDRYEDRREDLAPRKVIS